MEKDIFRQKMDMNENLFYDKPFILDNDYRILGLHKDESIDTNGDVHTLSFYRNYDEGTKTFTGLAVQEKRSYFRHSYTGFLTKRITDSIKWYDLEGNVFAEKTSIPKFYNDTKGFEKNKRARQNIVNKASLALFQELINANPATADANVDDFQDLTDSAVSKYLKSNMTPLLNILNNSVVDDGNPSFRSYMTPAIKDSLIGILNIVYGT